MPYCLSGRVANAIEFNVILTYWTCVIYLTWLQCLITIVNVIYTNIYNVILT